MDTITLSNYYRHDIIKLLPDGGNNIGVELGVAKGEFSSRMVKSGAFTHFFGVDMYADHHDIDEYRSALAKVGLYANYKLLRMKFDEAIKLFDDQSLDFVYVDGYAHTGEEGGETIFDWFSKVKVGGIIAGDDYHSDWPVVIEAVNALAEATAQPLHLTEVTEDVDYCWYPTWAIKKAEHRKLIAPEHLAYAKNNKPYPSE